MWVLSFSVINFGLLNGCGDETIIPRDGCPSHDFDCDGLSNAVENQPNNVALYGLDWLIRNQNPSHAIGTPSNGQLEGGLALPDNLSFYHYLGYDPPHTDDWGTARLVTQLEFGALFWRDINERNCRYWSDYFGTTPAPRFGIGDMSRQQGGYFSGHVSHQNGIDADIRFLRTDHGETAIDMQGPDSVNYDLAGTVDLINCLLYYPTWDHAFSWYTDPGKLPYEHPYNRVVIIFIDTLVASISPGSEQRVVHDTDHWNHFHVRVYQP